MFRIWRVHDDIRPVDKRRIIQVQEILAGQFPGVDENEISNLPVILRDPMKQRLRYLLLVAEDQNLSVNGFALAAYATDLSFYFLDFLSAAPRLTGRGLGGALYQRLRHEAAAAKAVGIFMECLPDDPKLCRDSKLLAQNRARLRFYEGFGARPIIGTKYETPVGSGDDCPPYLVYDGLGRDEALRGSQARKIVRAILERKYKGLCSPQYVDMVVNSFQLSQVFLREPRYRVAPLSAVPSHTPALESRIQLVVTDRHQIHHVRERGYVEAPVRINSILKALEGSSLFNQIEPKTFSLEHLKAIHDPGFLNYIKRMCSTLEPGKALYPYVFPVRNSARPPKEMPVRAGYYCIDTFTPLSRNAYLAARRAVDCALTGAKALLQGSRLAYALVRPPAHHAERKVFGGFCYLNSTAAAAQMLSSQGKVAVIDLDYHHGNGTQDIFYQREDVLTFSIHGHPRFAYPYFSGFKDETGTGPGLGFNHNLPLPEKVDGTRYIEVLDKVIGKVRRFSLTFLVVALGLDTAKGDPTGTWSLMRKDFETNGRMVGELCLPTLVMQEGGYRTRNLGINLRSFMEGLWGDC
jgi:acetoin utilization deacetylase AcuC-like enzyme/GNAT superfamily N-acetyltransferase